MASSLKGLVFADSSFYSLSCSIESAAFAFGDITFSIEAWFIVSFWFGSLEILSEGILLIMNEL